MTNDVIKIPNDCCIYAAPPAHVVTSSIRDDEHSITDG